MSAAELPPAVQLFDDLAAQYQARYQDVSAYHESLTAFVDALPENGRVLDLACGPGNVTRFLLDQRPDLAIWGTDLAPQMLEIAGTVCPEASFAELDLKAVASLSELFDGICCAFGLPYLSREEAILCIHDCAGQLAPGGVLYLSTMEDAYTRSGPQSSAASDRVLNVYYHERAYLIEALQAANLELLLEHDQPLSQDAQDTSRDLVLIGQKKATLPS